MSVSKALQAAISETLRAAGYASPIRNWHPIGGGDINQAARIETIQARYFVKWHRHPPPRFFECEAEGLRLLARADTCRVPHVVGSASVPEEATAFLVLEWIETTGKSTQAAEILGRQLAEQHRTRQPFYGLDADNYIGNLPQPNLPHDSWIEFYRTERLGAQQTQAQRNGLMPAHRARLLDTLMDRLSNWINEADCQPSLLHGDLWGGNWMQASDAQPILIDPAVYYGDREADLAMTALFGGFPQGFYDAYAETYPLADGYRDRQPLYQLYYLLCHLNLFGEGYGTQVDSVLRRYVSR